MVAFSHAALEKVQLLSALMAHIPIPHCIGLQ